MSATEVSYQVDGRGPPLYLVHGIGSRKTVWDDLIAGTTNNSTNNPTTGLDQHFTCVRYDLRGHGQSPRPEMPYTLQQLVDDLEGLRRRLGHEKIHIVGHSLGGMIGPAYARQYPQRVCSLGLLSTAAGRGADDLARLQAVLNAMQTRGVESVVGTLVARWYTDAFINARPDAIEERIRQVIDTPPEVFLNVFRIYLETEMMPWLSEITCPCLVLTGALDRACTPALNAAIASALPNAELVIVDNLKHSILIEDPQRVLAPLKKFLCAQIA